MEAPSSSTAELPAGRIRKRRYSTARIQPTRIKKVMQSDEEIGRMIASVPVAIGSVMEHFTEKLLEAASNVMHYTSSKTLSPQHLYTAVSQTPHFSFLMPLVKNIGPTVTNQVQGQVNNVKAEYQSYGLASIKEEEPEKPASSSSDEGVKRKRGRPKKEIQTDLTNKDALKDNLKRNGIIESNPERDRELMPPPPLIRKFDNSLPISSSTTNDSQPQKQTDAISA